MMDLHDRFDDWLAGGAQGEPPRDLALHASTCDGCLRAVAVVESLQAIQVEAAGLPPQRSVPGRPRPFRIARMVVGALAAIVLAVSVGIGASGMLGTPLAADDPATPTAEGVLAGGPTAAATERSASASPTPSASETPTPGPSATDAAAASPEPTSAPQPPPPPPPPFRTPAPLPPPPTAPPPTAAPTPAPTAPPTPQPPTPSPSPTLAACSNLADDDGDLLIDFPADPGCTDLLDNDETDPGP
jgi:outer membrane biosynthesis protein TonB